MNPPRRKPLRLAGYNYAENGAYFVTICTQNRECLLGTVMNGEMKLNDLGLIVSSCWQGLPSHYPHVVLDAFVVMPNHLHGIIGLSGASVAADPLPGKRHALPEVVRGFKTFSARGVASKLARTGTPTWQRGYYERVIRNEQELARIREYILNNPLQWEIDRENPAALRTSNSRPAPVPTDELEAMFNIGR